MGVIMDTISNIVDILQRLANNNNLYVKKIDDSGRIIEFSCSGFSKYNKMNCVIHYDDNLIKATSRYNSSFVYEAYDDIMYQAFYLWQTYQEHGYNIPEEFKEDFLKKGLVKVKTIEIYEVPG